MTAATKTSSSNPWWKGAVIYQIYPRSFKDSTGSGIGDIAGITQKLDYVASLGVDAIWLSPFFQSPMEDMGYDVSDYCAVDPIFGTIEDFDQMVGKAHALGLKVIIDQVISHTSDEHPWFRQSRASRTNDRADWYVWADPKPDGTAPNNWMSVFGGPAWEWDGVRKQYYMHNFLASQPDLNFHNHAVQDALLDTVKFWLERGVDGFRLDTVNYYFHDRDLRDNPPHRPDSEDAGLDAPDVNPYGMQSHLHDKTQPENIGFLKRFRSLLDQYPDRATVGEVGDGARSLETVAAYTSGDDKLNMCYTFDFLGPDFSARHIRGCVEAVEKNVADGWICWAFSNHDVNRHVSRFSEAGDDPTHVAKLAISVLASLKGSLCLYQGEELGLPEADLAFEDLRDPYGIRFWPAFKGRDGCRTPMVWDQKADNGGFSTSKPWLPVPDAHLKRAVSVQDPDEESVLSHYRQTLAFRRAHPAVGEGDIAFLDLAPDVLAFTRSWGKDKLLFVFNLTRAPVDITLPKTLAVKGTAGMPGLAAEAHGQRLMLAALEGYCGRL